MNDPDDSLPRRDIVPLFGGERLVRQFFRCFERKNHLKVSPACRTGRSTGVTPENTMHAQVPSRVVCRRLDWDLSAADVLRLLRADPHPAALLGAWAGGSDIVAAAPVRVGKEPDATDPGDLTERAGGACFGGGWIGYLGFGAARGMLPVPPAGLGPERGRCAAAVAGRPAAGSAAGRLGRRQRHRGRLPGADGRGA